ncbi:MAG: NADH-quinone oxidoreductase subunit N [Candidatus Amoebophilus sp.]
MINLINISIADSIVNNYKSLPWILPGLWIVGTFIVNIIIQLIARNHQQSVYQYLSTILGLLGTLYASIKIKQQILIQKEIILFNNLLQVDSWSTHMHILLISITLFIILILCFTNRPYKSTDYLGTYLLMILATLLGAYLLVISYHWLLVYLSIGCMTVGSTVLIYENGNRPTYILASTRYLIYSVVASAIMLVGLSYLYGSMGTLELYKFISYNEVGYSILQFIWPIGFFLALSGLLMSIGSFPFQFWVASVYQHTSFSTVAYLSTVPKLAGIAFLVRLHRIATQASPFIELPLKSLWACIAMATMVVGHLGALTTKDAKKLLAYGSIAQTGFLLAIIVTDMSVYTHITYYIIVYTIMNLASWFGLQMLSYHNITKNPSIEAYAGLGRQLTIGSICFLIIMLALIGIPPTAGFSAKLIIFNHLWESAQLSKNILLTSLFIISILGTILALYYYLKLPYILFFKSRKLQIASMDNWPMQILILLLAILLVGLTFINKLFIN